MLLGERTAKRPLHSLLQLRFVLPYNNITLHCSSSSEVSAPNFALFMTEGADRSPLSFGALDNMYGVLGVLRHAFHY